MASLYHTGRAPGVLVRDRSAWLTIADGRQSCQRREKGISHLSNWRKPLSAQEIYVACLTRITHEHFCCNRRSAATTSLRPAGSPLGSSTYCTSTHRVLTAPRAGLATRLSNFATNRHEQCGLRPTNQDLIRLSFAPFPSTLAYAQPSQECRAYSRPPTRLGVSTAD